MTEISLSADNLDRTSYFEPHETLEMHGLVYVLGQIAANAGVQIIGRDMEYWHMMGYTVRAVDTLIDDKGYEADQIGVSIRGLIATAEPFDGYSPDMAVRFKRMYDQLPEGRRSTVLGIPEFVELAHKRFEASTVRASSEAVREEGARFAQLFGLEEGAATDRAARRRFNKLLEAMTHIGYAIDSLVDMEEDYRSGRSKVVPSGKGRALLAFNMLGDVFHSREILKVHNIKPGIKLLRHFTR